MSEHLDVKALRESLGWTQEKLAEHIGLDRSSVSRMENGQPVKGPVLRLLLALAANPPEATPSLAEAS